MEHRWGRRIAVDAKVRIFADPASTGWGRLRDISISGGFIETALRVPVLSTLSVTVPGGCVVHAIAVRNALDGVGVEWADGGLEVIAALIQEAASCRTPSRIADELRV